MNPISFSVKRPVAIMVIFLALLVIGLFSMKRIGIDLFPAVDFPYITITTTYTGASPSDIETLISKKIEDAVSEIDGIKHISSTSMEDVSQVFIEFELDKDIDIVAMDVREKIDLIHNQLPEDADTPIIQKLDVNAKPVMNLSLTGNRDMVELYTLADEMIKDQLSMVSGVASVEILGGKRREILLAVDQDKLTARQLSLDMLIDALHTTNLDIPSGHVTQKEREYAIRLEGELSSLDQIRQIFINNIKGQSIPITDVCTITDTHAEQRMMTILDGRECIGLSVKKRGDANVVAVVESLYKKLKKMSRILPPGVKLEVVNDDSNFIKASIADVRNSILIGILLTTLVLFVFLHNIRLTIIAALTMPISIIATFILLRFAGFTFNLMSLMALGISVGILVDNAIVVLENIFNYRQKGRSSTQAAEEGTKEIALAVLGSTMTNLVVFLPIAFMSGIIGKFFRQFGLTAIFAAIVSLLVSFTLTPTLYCLLSGHEDSQRLSHRLSSFYALWDRWYTRVADTYGRFVKKSLTMRWLVILIALALFFAAAMLVPYIGGEFITEADRAELTVSLELPPGTPLEKTRRVMEEIDRIVHKEPEVEQTFATVGKSEGLRGKSSRGTQLGQMIIELSDKADRQRSVFEIADELRPKLQHFPDSIVSLNIPGSMGGAEAVLQMEISGDDFSTLEGLSRKVLNAVHTTRGTTDIETSWQPGKPQISIYPDRINIKDLGLSVAQVGSVIRNYVEGKVASKFRVQDKEYDIRVKLAEHLREDISQIKDFSLFLPNGKNVPLSQVSRIEKTFGPTTINRKDKRRVIIVSANLIKGASLADVIKTLRKTTSSFFETGYDLFFAGRAERMKESFGELFGALILAGILTYLVMAALMESFLQPFSIMFAFPLAMIGVWVALFLTHMTFSIFSLMAIVMLVGYVVNNAILILDYTIILEKDQGMTRNEALSEACRVRLRPILMTTLTTIFGMLPLALALGWGAETRAPMAVVFIGGLFVSSLLTLFVIPVIYTYLDDVTLWIKRAVNYLVK